MFGGFGGRGFGGGIPNHVPQQAGGIAERNIKKQLQEKQAEKDRAEEELKAAEIKKQLDQAATQKSDRVTTVDNLNKNAILALQTGNLPAIVELFEKLTVEERADFNSVEPLLQALDKKDFIMTDYLLTKGFSCDVWKDYVEEDKNPELATKLRAALAKPAARLSM